MLAGRLKLLSGMLMSVFAPAKGKPFSRLDSVANCIKAGGIKIMACEGMRLAPFVRSLIVGMGQWHNNCDLVAGAS